MPARKSHRKSMKKTKPPIGFEIIGHGTIKDGDMAWADGIGEWKELQSTEEGNQVGEYVAIARKKLI